MASKYNLPDKLYFRIGEVSDIVDVKPYVLRYWETEFPDVKPTKSKSGQRLYKKKDVELLLKIKELLYDERFTINGAKQRLKDLGKLGSSDAPQVEKKVKGQKVQVYEEPASGVNKKFLKKVKGDLEWCLAEIRSE